MSCAFLYHSLPYIPEIESVTEPGTFWVLVRLTASAAIFMSLSSSAGVTGALSYAYIFMWALEVLMVILMFSQALFPHSPLSYNPSPQSNQQTTTSPALE